MKSKTVEPLVFVQLPRPLLKDMADTLRTLAQDHARMVKLCVGDTESAETSEGRLVAHHMQAVHKAEELLDELGWAAG